MRATLHRHGQLVWEKGLAGGNTVTLDIVGQGLGREKLVGVLGKRTVFGIGVDDRRIDLWRIEFGIGVGPRVCFGFIVRTGWSGIFEK